MRVVLFVVLVLGLCAGVISLITRIDQSARASQREWLEFSAAHECHIKQPPSFGHPVAIWSCAGFDVYHE